LSGPFAKDQASVDVAETESRFCENLDLRILFELTHDGPAEGDDVGVEILAVYRRVQERILKHECHSNAFNRTCGAEGMSDQ
jgi:hypothetical protein